MKILIVVTVFMGLPAFAETASFESFLSRQAVTSISPVTFDGAPVASRSKHGELDAAHICAALGFTRTVSSETELVQFQLGDQVAFSRNSPGGAPVFKTETVGKRKMNVLTSVECAK